MINKLLVLAILLAPAAAHADDGALLVDVTHLMPHQGVNAGGDGGGAELRFFDDHEQVTGGFGAFAVVGAQGTDQRQDLLDVHASIGFKALRSERFAPYGALGLDVLHVTTYRAMQLDVRGSTLGIDAQAGVLGTLGERVVWRASMEYLGAIVPGTGDDLGGLLFQIGLGFRLHD